jgi:hypothetical protein
MQLYWTTAGDHEVADCDKIVPAVPLGLG